MFGNDVPAAKAVKGSLRGITLLCRWIEQKREKVAVGYTKMKKDSRSSRDWGRAPHVGSKAQGHGGRSTGLGGRAAPERRSVTVRATRGESDAHQEREPKKGPPSLNMAWPCRVTCED